MLLSGFSMRRAVAGLIGSGAVAGAMLFGGAVAGLGFALYLTYIEGHVLGVWCILCLSSLAVIATTAIVAAVIWWRGGTQ